MIRDIAAFAITCSALLTAKLLGTELPVGVILIIALLVVIVTRLEDMKS